MSPCAICLHVSSREERDSVLFICPLSPSKYCDEVCPELSLPQGAKTYSFSLFSFSLSSLPSFGHFLLSASFLHCGYQPDKWWGEWNDHVSICLSNAPVDTAQGLILLCCCSAAPRTYVQLAVFHQDSQATFSRVVPPPHRVNLYWPFWIFHPKSRTWHLSLLNFMWFCLPFLPGLSVRTFSLLMCSTHQSVWCCQQTWRFKCHHLGH